jgi:predicted nucleotidyltransferase
VQRRVLKLQVLDSPNPTAAFTTVRTAAHHIDIPESDVDILFDTDAPNLFMTAMMKQDLEKLLGRPVDLLQVRGLTN